MSLITRCPSCATSFKVVADQLRISEGWVRCGECNEVFDASAHLLAVAPVPPSPAGPHPEEAAPVPAWVQRGSFDPDSEVTASPPHHAAFTNPVHIEQDDAQEHDPPPGFVRAAQRKAFWRKPAVRALLGAVLLLSVLGLALQIAVHERDRIVAMDARARPWLMLLCAPLRCEISPPRQIAGVVIDSSSFNKARGDSYQLAFTIRSRAAIALAMPAIELTLTDALDQPVLRRVLLPTDMAAPAELPALGEWSASVAVIVTTGGARVAGYRLLAFYP
ncbi:zinc-ribbon and DUF3426 domain-containing protein [Verminephrobacter aporrectodeae]|uniref:zinc-ribbon and DUF3426 domain-containing protein n=1 Tax=Verminephrobacter aporrectodeae TaxID=1110389 RepID=UPI002244B56A|nr:zinc-ribbon and DUF3426 domain-containing protein [Verminephrobacter aporrectodeae]MCW8174093.1 DUF3426 domain-containing protein [Verminephrobacter aporrectodeae subsp. tuberculatae]MCW8201622.1 DUF3426 domain-containing protein [Verminephrobacter aporrectodeae subsp. tuberculatae]